MKRKPRKLALNRETVRNLQDDSLKDVKGLTTVVCTGTVGSDCCTRTACTACTCTDCDTC